MKNTLIFILSLLILSSCDHLVKPKSAIQQGIKIPEISHFEPSSSISYSVAKKEYKSSYGKIELKDHPEVDKWIRYFTGRGRNLMRTYLERSSRYLPIMKTVIRDAGLPDELVYVALIESGFSPRAHSSANAVGYWQFIRGTGKRYGLRIDGYVDERKDPVLSTHAAVNYFKDLYSLFGSWPLALSSYNAGEYRINRAVLRHYNRNYWYLISKKALPRETRNYVPKLIATIRIANNPAKYGFYNIKFHDRLNYDVVSISKPISLKKLAANLNIPKKELHSLNPMYKGEYVPVYNNKPAHLRLPVGTVLSQVALEQSRVKNPPAGYHNYYWYRVRSGDSLYKIARRHKITIASLRKANGLRRRSLIHPRQKLKIPSRRLIASKSPKTKSKKEFYIVKRGDGVSRIARNNGLKIAQLRSLNKLTRKSVIHPGQKLRVRAYSKSQKNTRNVASTSKKRYTVRSGDTLISIARKYKIDLTDLMKANSLNFKSVLLAGTRLTIPR